MISATVGEYRILNRIGAGGMGEVYLAAHPKLGRKVAVKVLNDFERRPDFGARFLNEARIQAGLSHPNIATLYDFLECNGRPCIVMEYVDGTTLAERIAATGAMPPDEAARVFRGVVEAVRYIHSHGVIHRDIKSNNVKINSAGEVKLLDFGIARADSASRFTATGKVIGTFEYLSPEQLKGGAADARSDLWALGILFYEMITGRTPFSAPTIGELYTRISKAVYIPPSGLNPSAPREMEAIIARCLKKNPADRYQSARELLDDLRRLTTSAPPQPSKRPALTSMISARMKGWMKGWMKGRMEGRMESWMKNRRRLLASITAAAAIATALFFYPFTPPPAGTGEVKQVRIDVTEGRASVYRDGELVGATPCQIEARVGEEIDLTLKSEGYADKSVEFSVTENKKVYTFTMTKGE